MNIAFCYENVLPTRGGCETYISDLARRLCADRHQVHLYASRWDEKALPRGIVYHALPVLRGPRFLRPWRFGWACLKAMKKNVHDVTMGFDKTWGQDVLYPQGGLHLASAEYNLKKFRWGLTRTLVRASKSFDLAGMSFRRLERKQYLSQPRPLVIVNSHMVRDHFRRFYPEVPRDEIFVVRSAIDPHRFNEIDRLRCREEFRQTHGISSSAVVGLMAAMNYRLKGLDPLLHAVKRLLARPADGKNHADFRLVVAGNPSNAAYRRQAARLGIDRHVVFVGHQPDMRTAYFAADFLVHPTFYDPCSLVALESLACGLPVITTRANGASELLHVGKNDQGLQEGYVVDDPHDHERLASCMAELFDAGRRAEFAQAARRTAARWTFEHHYRQLLSVFAAVMARKEAA